MDMIEKAKEAAFKAAYASLSGADYEEVHTAVMIAIDAYEEAHPKLHFVFDDFPSPEGSRLIEVEDDSGFSVSLEWAHRNDGNVELCVNSPASLVEENKRLRKALNATTNALEMTTGGQLCANQIKENRELVPAVKPSSAWDDANA